MVPDDRQTFCSKNMVHAFISRFSTFGRRLLRRFPSRLADTWPRVGPASIRVPRLSVVVFGDELSIVYVLLLGSVGESRREVATLCPRYAPLARRRLRHTLLAS